MPSHWWKRKPWNTITRSFFSTCWWFLPLVVPFSKPLLSSSTIQTPSYKQSLKYYHSPCIYLWSCRQLMYGTRFVQALPRQSLYFTNYTMFAITGNFVFGLLRFYPMIRRHFRLKSATSPQEVSLTSCRATIWRLTPKNNEPFHHRQKRRVRLNPLIMAGIWQ